MNKSYIFLLVFFVAVATCSDVPESYVDSLCEEYNDGIDCCVGLVAPTPCPTSADCPIVTTPEPTTESCPTPEPTTACPTFAPPAPCPTLAPSVCDTCDTLTQDCVWNEGTDTLECVCKQGYVNTTESDCAYAQLEWVDFTTDSIYTTFRETDGVVDDYTINWIVDYQATFDITLNQDFTPFKTVAPFLVDEDNPSIRWQFPNDPVEFFNPGLMIADFTISELDPYDRGVGLYYLQYDLDLRKLDIASVKQIREALLDGGRLYVTMGSTVNSTDAYTYEQVALELVGQKTSRMYYSTQGRTNIANAPCFHDAQCDLGYSTCGGFDPAFPDTPGACVCTHGALTSGVCPPATACDFGSCSFTRRLVDIGNGLHEVQCIDDIIDVQLSNLPVGPAAVTVDLNSIDLKYGYSTTMTGNVELYYDGGLSSDEIIADVQANWTVSADYFLYDDLNGLNMTVNPYPFTEGTVEFLSVATPFPGFTALYYIIQIGTSQLSTAQKAELAKTVFDNGGSKLFVDVTVYTGAEDNRYITSGCTSNRPKIRDSQSECYFLTETECVGGCDYSTVDDIICTPP